VELKKTLKLNPISIQVVDRLSYKVVFDQGDREVEYTFKISEGAADVLGWEHRFWEDLGGDVSLARPIFESIMHLHKARKIEMSGE
tara:strand:- start:281 stop:538 length:258 start_codon:yes stop_codon:yes gene_type:complete